MTKKDEDFYFNHYRIEIDGKKDETIFPSFNGAEESAVAHIEKGAKVVRIYKTISMHTKKKGKVILREWL
jgi:hypothetical protein